MEISKMLTLSTAHITRETAEALGSPPSDHTHEWLEWFSYYDKADYGWWIPTNSAELKQLPPDLAACIRFAKSNGCDWLCLDCDGPIENCLPTYEWE